MRHSKGLCSFLALIALIMCIPDRSDAYYQSRSNPDIKKHKVIHELPSKHRPVKHFLNEFVVTGGNSLGDEWRNTWDIGGTYSLYFNKTFGIAAGYLYSPLVYDANSSFGQSITTDATHSAHGELIINNECAFKAGNSLIECDLFMTFGGGAIQINDMWKFLILIGGGIRIYTPLEWFALRFDVTSFMHPTPNPAGNTFNSDIALNMGLSFFIPTSSKKKEMEKDEEEDQSSGSLDGNLSVSDTTASSLSGTSTSP